MAQSFLARCADGRCSPLDVDASTSGLNIQGSVGRGGRNDPTDVRQIQQALNQVPVGEGGPVVPLDVDGFVGPKTETAIFQFQKRQFGLAKADSRVDPGQYTLAKLREFQDDQPLCDASPGGANATVDHSQDTPVLLRVYANLPQVMSWTSAAIRQLQNAEDYLRSSTPDWMEASGQQSLLLVDRCFHVIDLGPDRAVQAIWNIRRIFRNMQMVVGHFSEATDFGTGYFQPATSGFFTKDKKLVFAYTFPGGWTATDRNNPNLPATSNSTGETLREDAIYICTDASKDKSSEDLTDMLIHELAHFVGPEKGFFQIVDHAYGTAALQLNHQTAIRTASCYAWLAWLARKPMSEWQTATA
jgi:peptidoglycan hydrolase-like protein with peptidoglycan-binding domain